MCAFIKQTIRFRQLQSSLGDEETKNSTKNEESVNIAGLCPFYRLDFYVL